jgi:hypothetical protein
MHRNTRQTLRRYYDRGLLDRPPPKREVREDPFDFATEEEGSTYDAVKHYIDRRFEELEEQRCSAAIWIGSERQSGWEIWCRSIGIIVAVRLSCKG